jgi:hypothetical protein
MNTTRTVGGMDAQRLLGMLHLGGVAPLFLAAGIITLATFSGGMLSGDGDVLCITTAAGAPISLLLIVLAIPGIVAGIGLIRHRPWAPALSLVLAVLNILAVPIGTTISILTFWVFREDLERMFGKAAPGSS